MRRPVLALAALAGSAALALGAGPALAANTAQSSIVTANPADFTPQVMDGSVNALVQVGNRLIAAGTFTTVRQTPTGPDVVRNKLFAVDATTGAIDTGFNPDLGGGDANSLATDGTDVYVGGTFNTVNGVTAARVAKLDPATGAIVTPLKSPNSAVNEVVVRGSRLYVGGAFKSVGTAARTALAAYDTTSGALLPQVDIPFAGLYNGGSTTIKRMDLSPDGTKLTAVGNFTTVGGVAHSQVVVIDTPPTGTATVSSWATDRFDRSRNPQCANVYDSFVRDVDYSPDGTYFVISATGAYGGGPGVGTVCDTTSRWTSAATGAGQQPTWIDYTGGDTTYGVAISGTAVYVGGHFRWENNAFQGDQAGPGAVAREGIAALDPVNGLPLSWNPGRDRGVGAQALLTTSAGLWVGSDTKHIGGETHQRLAFFPLAGGTTPPTVTAAPLPGTFYQATSRAPGVLTKRSIGANGVPTSGPATVNTTFDWSTLRGGFLVNGTLYYGLGDGRIYARTFGAGTVGSPRAVNMYDDPDTGQRIPFAVSTATGMFYDPAQHRIYYTVAGDAHLYYRYFTPESEVIGAQTFTASTSVDLSRAAGLALAGGRVFYGSSADGALRSVAFTGGNLSGAATVVSSDGTWTGRALLSTP